MIGNTESEIKPGKKLFGILPDGKEVFYYTLKNSSGMSINVMNYGAIVTAIKVPDKLGNFKDVVLGFDTIDKYIADGNYIGGIVGRYGNRIKDGKFKLNEKEYQVSVNDGENHLHGGFKCFIKVLWDMKIKLTDNEKSVVLNYVSKDGEEGFPGEVHLEVKYTLTEENELVINYSGTTDKTTILNPTHHSYFNLTGNPHNTILDHEMKILAGKYTEIEKGMTTTGRIVDVEGSVMDFRSPKPVGLHIDDNFEQLTLAKGYDHNWVLDNYNKEVRKVAEVFDPISGRLMEISTDQPGLQFYSGNYLNESVVGKKGIPYKQRSALCCEAQLYPDTPNKPEFPSAKLEPGEIYKQTTIYKFSVR